jgi:hypothetical protein
VLNSVYPELESAWFPTLGGEKLVSKFGFSS